MLTRVKRTLRQGQEALRQGWEGWQYAELLAQLMPDQAANDWVREALESQRSLLVGRMGRVEARCLGEWRYRGGRWSRRSLRELHTNAGVFPLTVDALQSFAAIYDEALEAVDLLGFWQTEYQARLVRDLDSHPSLCSLGALEPYWAERPWTAALAGRRVLVVHPFAETMLRQYQQHRTQLFWNPHILPEFDLQGLLPPLTLGDRRGSFSTWSEALADLMNQVAEREFDIALIGCGAYGLPLASAVKRMGRQAVHLGGATQLLFGIRGRRWEAMPAFRALMNGFWCRPSADETPVEATRVEGGCYW